jgi:hypothetical protein
MEECGAVAKPEEEILEEGRGKGERRYERLYIMKRSPKLYSLEIEFLTNYNMCFPSMLSYLKINYICWA